jgi:hypothetical protein
MLQSDGVIDIAPRDAAPQVGVDILQVLGLGAVNVTREVKVVIVFRVGDFVDRDHAGIARVGFVLPSFRKPLEASIMKMPLRAVAFSLSSTRMQAGMPVP